MNRRGFLLALVTAPALPLAIKWTQPKPDYGRALAASVMETKWVRQATIYNPAVGAPYRWVENTVQAHSRDVYREFVEHWKPKGWVLE